MDEEDRKLIVKFMVLQQDVNKKDRQLIYELEDRIEKLEEQTK